LVGEGFGGRTTPSRDGEMNEGEFDGVGGVQMSHEQIMSFMRRRTAAMY